MPKRIQRKRTKGWRMPPGAIYCGRPGRLGNPFVVGKPHRLNGGRVVKDAAQAVELYELHTGPMGSYEFDSEDLTRLRGHDLACWCSLDQPCHVDVILSAANPEVSGGAGEAQGTSHEPDCDPRQTGCCSCAGEAQEG